MDTRDESPAAAWDQLWSRIAAAGHELPPPHPDVVRLAGRLGQAGVRRIYDLGCGSGRHTAYLAARGFQVYASDLSAVAVDSCRTALAAAGLPAEVTVAPMTRIAYPDAFFDWVLAVNVLYHGRRGDLLAALAEARRALRPGGWLFVALLSTADAKLGWYEQEVAAGRAVALEPGTYRALRRGPTDEHVPHTFVAAADLGRVPSSEFRVAGPESAVEPPPAPPLLDGFEVVELREQRSHHPDFHGQLRAQAYWHVLARRPVRSEGS